MPYSKITRGIRLQTQITILLLSTSFVLSCSSMGKKGRNVRMTKIYKKIILDVPVYFSENPWYRSPNAVNAPKASIIAQKTKIYPYKGPKTIIKLAKRYLGIPYKYGGTSPSMGFDCSGLVKYVYSKIGLTLPRSTKKQFEISSIVHPKNARPGDLLFFDIEGNGVSHVGIYLGKMKFIHAPRTGSVVKIVSLNNSYWKKRFVSVRRI